MKLSNWPDITPINQKNYYTWVQFNKIFILKLTKIARDFMKRDDQLLAVRLQNEATRDKLVQPNGDHEVIEILSEAPRPGRGRQADEQHALPSRVLHPVDDKLAAQMRLINDHEISGRDLPLFQRQW